MNGSIRAVGAKVHAKYGKMLTADDYKLLLSKQSVPEIAVFLKTETSYSDVLNNIQEMLIHRGQLENLLKKDTYNKYLLLRRYLSSDKKQSDFFSYFLINTEIEQILNCILYINANIVEKIIIDFPSFLLKKASFDVEQLAQIKTFNDLLTVLIKTPYYKILEKFKSETLPINYTDCEISLYSYYYSFVFKMIDKQFFGGENQALKEIFKLKAELFNLSTIFRLKHFYKLKADNISEYLLPLNYKISKQKIEELINAENEDDLFELIKKLPYSKYSELTIEKHTFIERYSDKVLFTKAKRFLQMSNYPSVAFVNYLILCDIEIKNIINIIEGVRYKATTSDIEKLLIN